MKPLGLTFLAIPAVALAIVAAPAYAQPDAPNVMLVANDFSAPTYGPGAAITGGTIEWDSRKGRWGLKLGMEQHTDRLSEWRDVQPGLYYKLTPRLHIGGAVSLTPNPTFNPRMIDPQGPSPRVRLETTFKF